jgi:hypothetical protein
MKQRALAGNGWCFLFGVFGSPKKNSSIPRGKPGFSHAVEKALAGYPKTRLLPREKPAFSSNL